MGRGDPVRVVVTTIMAFRGARCAYPSILRGDRVAVLCGAASWQEFALTGERMDI